MEYHVRYLVGDAVKTDVVKSGGFTVDDAWVLFWTEKRNIAYYPKDRIIAISTVPESHGKSYPDLSAGKLMCDYYEDCEKCPCKSVHCPVARLELSDVEAVAKWMSEHPEED